MSTPQFVCRILLGPRYICIVYIFSFFWVSGLFVLSADRLSHFNLAISPAVLRSGHRISRQGNNVQRTTSERSEVLNMLFMPAAEYLSTAATGTRWSPIPQSRGFLAVMTVVAWVRFYRIKNWAGRMMSEQEYIIYGTLLHVNVCMLMASVIYIFFYLNVYLGWNNIPKKRLFFFSSVLLSFLIGSNINLMILLSAGHKGCCLH